MEKQDRIQKPRPGAWGWRQTPQISVLGQRAEPDQCQAQMGAESQRWGFLPPEAQVRHHVQGDAEHVGGTARACAGWRDRLEGF